MILNMFNLYILAIIMTCLICQIIIITQCKEIIKKKDSEIATIVHDLKTPINAIYRILNILQTGELGALTKEQAEIIELSRNSGKYMLNLVNTLTSGYECDYNKHQMHKTIFNITEVINVVCCQNEYLAREKSQRIIFNTNNIQCNIFADKLQIERVIYNLLSNAITYGFKNSDIILKLESDKNFINFSVTNTAYPIPEQEMKNIFKKFH